MARRSAKWSRPIAATCWHSRRRGPRVEALPVEPLPDAHAAGRLQIEFIRRLHAEGLVPGVDVAHHAIDAKTAIGMRVAYGQLADVVFACGAAPDLRERQKEPLIAAQAVDVGRRLVVQ